MSQPSHLKRIRRLFVGLLAVVLALLLAFAATDMPVLAYAAFGLFLIFAAMHAWVMEKGRRR